MGCRCSLDSINSLDHFYLPHKATYKDIKTRPTMAPHFFTAPNIFVLLKLSNSIGSSQSHDHACMSKFDKVMYVVL